MMETCQSDLVVFIFFNWWGERPREPSWHCKNRLAGSMAPPKNQSRYKVAPGREVEQFDFVQVWMQHDLRDTGVFDFK